MLRHAAWLGAVSCLLFACASSKGSAAPPKGEEDPGLQARSLIYQVPCNPEACSSPPSTAIDVNGLASCLPTDGTCGWKAADPNEPVSFSQCEESKCGAVPQIGCAPGYHAVPPVCGSINGAACAYQTTCAADVSDVACDDTKCGPMPELAPICDDGSTGNMVCRAKTDGCGWVPDCK